MSISQPILIVDDDQTIRSTMIDILTSEGYTVLSAANGAEALDLVEVQRPALVLLDMRMPVLNGWGFAQALAARSLSLPIVVMTAAQDARQWAGEIAATAVLTKPFDIIEMLTIIERVMAEQPGV
jgi:CheY-like chemotaxis protein